jgi:hypothetical protein
MFDLFREQILKQKYPKNLNRQFTSWDSVKSICLLLTKDDYFNEKTVSGFTKQSGKTVDVVLFHEDKFSQSDCFVSVNKKDLNFLKFPKEEISKKLKTKEFDILIDGNKKGSFATHALVQVVKAKCKVGHNGISYAESFDICMDLKAETGLESYLKQVLNYLMMIRTK